MTSPRTLVCGIGNILKQDDGIGPHVIRELEQRHLPANVTVADFGSSGFKTALEIGKFEKVIFVDAMQTGGEPGQVCRVTISEHDLAGGPSLSSCRVSLHESDLQKILTSTSSINNYPKEVVVLGCEPQDLSPGLGLSEKAQKAADTIIEWILEEIRLNKNSIA